MVSPVIYLGTHVLPHPVSHGIILHRFCPHYTWLYFMPWSRHTIMIYNIYFYSFTVQQPSFCALNSTEPCSHSMELPLPEVVESPGPTPQDHYVVLTNVGLWWQVAYKFRIPLVEGDVVSKHKINNFIYLCFHQVNYVIRLVKL